MIPRDEINEAIRGLSVEALHEGGCWVYADDPNAERLFGYRRSLNAFVDDPIYERFEITRSPHGDGVWIRFTE